MKRFLSAAGMIVMSLILIGCGHDTRDGLIRDTINMMNQASTQVNTITTKVTEATEIYSADKKKKLDFSAAIKAADELKKIGNKAQEIKRGIDMYRNKISSDDQQANAEKQKQSGELSAAFKKLVDRKNELRAALRAAEEMHAGGEKETVADLRLKIVEAEGPFESLTR